MAEQSRAFDPQRLLRSLARHEVRFVLVGALAARLYGFPRMTADADIVPARDTPNLERFAAALRELAAKTVQFEVYGETLLVARLEDLLRSKVAADRPQDRSDVILIREMIERSRVRDRKL